MELSETILEQDRKGITINRYKGLGEMNLINFGKPPLILKSGHYFKVKLNHLEEAEEIFSTLMGDVVEPRKEFIQTNALKVTNLGYLAIFNLDNHDFSKEKENPKSPPCCTSK